MREKTCYCVTCRKWFHHLGITRHRAAHRDRGEACEIIFSDGRRQTYNGKRKEQGRCTTLM